MESEHGATDAQPNPDLAQPLDDVGAGARRVAVTAAIDNVRQAVILAASRRLYR